MNQHKTINLAFDFGASSGRLMMSTFDGEKIELKEIHRFANEPVWVGGRYYWDFLRLFHELKTGLKKIANLGIKPDGIGIDTWGVDYGFLDQEDQLISNPVHYRDNRTEGMLAEIEQEGVPFKRIYDSTGIQYLAFNTLYQMYHDTKYRQHSIKNAKTMLFIPDLFAFYLTGKKYNEYTIASTGQLLDAEKRTWDMDLLKEIGLPTELLQDLIEPGTVWGNLTEAVQREVELDSVPVIAVGSHDTASAVAGAPLYSSNSAYLSCGTWSLLGMESDHPLINPLSYQYNFTNEGGVEGKIRFLKNITGLWIIQQMKKKWVETNPNIGYGEISKAAAEADYAHFMIDPDHESFVAPLNMVEAVQEYCKNNGQGVPKTVGEIARAAYNGIVDHYKKAVSNLEEITGKEIDVINMVGGGIQDQFLCQLTANTTGKKVVAGPIEASVLGNVVMQLKALGHIQSLEEAREIVKRSFEMKEYQPE